jgi:hypothetical protein
MKWGSASFSSRKGWTVLTLEVEERKCLLSCQGRAGLPRIQKTHEEGEYYAQFKQFKNKCTFANPVIWFIFNLQRKNRHITVNTCEKKVTRGIFLQ